MTDNNRDEAVSVNTDRARAGATPGVTRYVLGASLGLIIIVFVVAYFLF